MRKLESVAVPTVCENPNKEVAEQATFQDGGVDQQRSEAIVVDIPESITHLAQSSLSDDIGLWPPTLSSIQENATILRGPIQQELSCFAFPITKDEKFSITHFERRLRNGQIQKRSWLLYSKTKDAVYCFCCKLFSLQQIALTSGFSDWKNLTQNLSSHEISKEHFESLRKFAQKLRALKAPADIQLHIQHKYGELVEYWTAILQRLLAIIQHLARDHCAVRETAGYEQLGDSKQSQFLGLVELLSKFDPVLLEHITKMRNKQLPSDHYLGKSIQIELVELIGKQILESITARVRRSKYYSIILDCTPDYNHEEQMTLVVRYVDIHESLSCVSIKEHFTGFLNVKEATPSALTDVLLARLDELGLSIGDCKGQGCDNGANRAGRHSGVQKTILDLNEHALFMPCGSHSLNLVLCDSAKNCSRFFVYFGLLQKLYAVFSCSTKRWDILKQQCPTVVKYPSETRWESKISSVDIVRFHLEGVIKSLEQVLRSSQLIGDGASAAEINEILNEVISYDFILCSVIWHKVLYQVNTASKQLQDKSMQIDLALKHIKELVNWMKDFRQNGFQPCVNEATQFAESLEVEDIVVSTSFRPHRYRRGFFDEAENVSDNFSLLRKYEVEVFITMADSFISSTDERYAQLDTYQTNFGFFLNVMSLTPSDVCGDVLVDECEKLGRLLGDDIMDGVTLAGEIDSFVHIPNKDTERSALGALQYIVSSGMTDAYHYLSTALRIILTIPVSVASVERSVSKLKLIKTFLRSRMSQDCLNGLSLMYIEAEVSNGLDYNLLIDEFARQKARKCSPISQ